MRAVIGVFIKNLKPDRKNIAYVTSRLAKKVVGRHALVSQDPGDSAHWGSHVIETPGNIVVKEHQNVYVFHH